MGLDIEIDAIASFISNGWEINLKTFLALVVFISSQLLN